MKSKMLLTLTVALSTMLAGSARADLIAGWDFSQWAGDGFPSIDGATFTDVLTSNYSSLDPTFGAGIESAAFGTMYMNGQFGSTAQPLDGTDSFTPSQPLGGSLASNCVTLGPCDNFGPLASEGGQMFTELISMTAAGTPSVVFEANMESVPEFGVDWSLSLGGKTFGAVPGLNGIDVTVEFSVDGINFANVGAFTITSVDTPFTVGLGPDATNRAFVRLNFVTEPTGLNQALIDNVAISATIVPEPGTALLLGTGLAGLVAAGRRRRS